MMSSSCCPPPTYLCPCAPPGYLPEPYHIPGYSGHLPTIRERTGKTFGNASRAIIEDPCVAQAPCPVLQPPMCPVPPRTNCPKDKDSDSCGGDGPICIDQRECTLNRGPYACPCRPEPDVQIFRRCESVSPTYAGHIPAFEFHGTGKTTGSATFGIGTYMQKCWYKNAYYRM